MGLLGTTQTSQCPRPVRSQSRPQCPNLLRDITGGLRVTGSARQRSGRINKVMQLRLFKTLKMNNAIETTTIQPGNGISVRQCRALHHQPVGRSSSGFTLIEAAVAMLVTTVGLVAVAGSFAVAVKTNANSQNMTTATTFAQDKLEQLETATFQTLADPSKMSTNPNAPNSQYALIAGSLDQVIMTAA